MMGALKVNISGGPGLLQMSVGESGEMVKEVVEGDGVAPSKYAVWKVWSVMVLVDRLVISFTAVGLGGMDIGERRRGRERGCIYKPQTAQYRSMYLITLVLVFCTQYVWL